MRKFLQVGVLAAALLNPAFMGVARTWYVSPSGNDANPGTMAKPWSTLANANAMLVAGDTLLVHGGTYHEKIQPASSGVAGRPIVYRAYPGESVVVDGFAGQDLNTVYIDQDYIIVEGFMIKNQNYLDVPREMEYWVHVLGNHDVFRYNRVVADGNTYYNIYVARSLARSRGISVAGQFNIIEHCFVRGLDMGIVLWGDPPRYCTVRYDTVYATGSNNIDVTAAQVRTAYHGNLIEYCVLDTSFVEDNIQFEPDYGDPTSTLHNRGTIIRNNRMGNAAENAIDLKGAGHTIIDNNLIYTSHGDDNGPLDGNDITSGGGVTAIPNNPTQNPITRGNVIWDHSTAIDMAEGDHYFNNTILNNRRSYAGPNQADQANHIFTGLRAYGYPALNRGFINNIIGCQGASPEFDWRMDYSDKFTLDGNLYFEPAGQAKFYHRKNNTMITTTGLSAWRNELNTYAGYGYLQGKDAHSIESNPQFVNVPAYPADFDSTWDFGLKLGSPGINAGIPVTTATMGGYNSTTLRVDDAYYFCDGFGITDGDLIMIGTSAAVRITAIDFAANIITLKEPRSWSAGNGVHLAFLGSAPDIGAREFAGTVIVPPGLPQLVSPTNGAADVNPGTLMQWNAVDGATQYHVQVSTDAGFTLLFDDQAGLTEPSWPLSWITYSTKYYWRVSASNVSGSSGWSSVYAFTSAQDTTQPSPPSVNVLVNGDFITGTSPWLFYTSGTGTFDVVPDGCSTLHTARLNMQTTGANMQLYQEGITLQAGATYQLSFKGYSNSGHDVRVWIEKKGTPRTNYGLAGKAFDLGTSCAVYSAQFTAVGFSDTVHDARLLFWFSSNAVAGDQYFFDEMVLEKLNGVSKGLKKEGIAGEDGSRLPLTPTLVGNYPNPFNPSTLIEFQLPDRMNVEVTVFNTMGQRVAELADGTWEAGVHRVRWEGADDHGRALASGIYYLRMHTDDRVQTKRMVLLK